MFVFFLFYDLSHDLHDIYIAIYVMCEYIRINFKVTYNKSVIHNEFIMNKSYKTLNTLLDIIYIMDQILFFVVFRDIT